MTTIIVGHGPRATEAALLAELERLLASGPGDVARLASPVRVVVPSRSLRAHRSATLVQRRGRAVAGIAFQTLHALAAETCERAGVDLPGGTALFDVLVRRAAKAEPVLRDEL